MSDEQTVIPPARPRQPSTIRNLMPRLPERGHVKIGGLGEKRKSQGGNDYQLPVKYDHFKITTLERGQDGNFVVDIALHEKLGLGETPTEIPIRLLYDDIFLNLQTRYACYAGKQLWCSGDGVEAQRWSQEYGNKRLPDPFKVPCPCHRQDPSYTGQDRCKMNGRLATIIDGAGSVGGIWVFRTTSYNSITGLMSSLLLLHTLTGGVLANIPLKLVIQPKRVNSPVDGKAQTVYVVSVEFSGDIEELQDTGHKIALGRATAHVSIANIEEEARRLLALPMPENAVLPGDDPDAIVDEYYPEQNGAMAAVAQPAEPRPTREQFQQQPTPESEPTEPSYAVINADGEEEDVPLAALPGKLEAVFAEAASRGHRIWFGVGETNSGLVDILREQDRNTLADDLIALWQRLEPPKSGGMGGGPRPTPVGDAKPATTVASSPSETRERPGLFDELDWKLIAPTLPNTKINYPMLRDRLCELIGFCESGAELQKLSVDNREHLEAMVKDAPKFAEAIQGLIDTRRQVLGQ